MRVKLLLASMLIFLFSFPLAVRAEIPSNESFVRSAFEDMLDSMIAGLPAGDQLLLKFECVECPAEFFRNIIIARLKQTSSEVYIDNGNNSFDILEINLYNSNFYYGRSGASLFSKGNLKRHFGAGMNALMIGQDKRILWQNQIQDEVSEEIDWDSAETVLKRENGLFRAPIPESNRTRIWEPVLISGLLGGLVYLFFASR